MAFVTCVDQTLQTSTARHCAFWLRSSFTHVSLAYVVRICEICARAEEKPSFFSGIIRMMVMWYAMQSVLGMFGIGNKYVLLLCLFRLPTLTISHQIQTIFST